jgi:hypothetical protein
MSSSHFSTLCGDNFFTPFENLKATSLMALCSRMIKTVAKTNSTIMSFFFKKEVARCGERTQGLWISIIFFFSPLYR